MCQSGRKVVTHNSKSDLPLIYERLAKYGSMVKIMFWNVKNKFNHFFFFFNLQQDSSLGSFEGDPVVSEESLTDVETSHRRTAKSTTTRKVQEGISRHQTTTNVSAFPFSTKKSKKLDWQSFYWPKCTTFLFFSLNEWTCPRTKKKIY